MDFATCAQNCRILERTVKQKFADNSPGQWLDLWSRIIIPEAAVFRKVYLATVMDRATEDIYDQQISEPVSIPEAARKSPVYIHARVHQILMPVFFESFRDAIEFFEVSLCEDWMAGLTRMVESDGRITVEKIADEWEVTFELFDWLVQEVCSDNYSGAAMVKRVKILGGADRGFNEALDFLSLVCSYSPADAPQWSRVMHILENMRKIAHVVEKHTEKYGQYEFRALSGYRAGGGPVTRSDYRRMGGRFY